MEIIYRLIGAIGGFVAFVSTWFFCIQVYSFVGLLFGWLPAIVVGMVVAIFWPIILILKIII